jgi:hypothetical protein
MLAALADNGGPTQTHALLPGSPAIDAASDDCPPPATDQRGVSRPQGAKCDIGAFELVPGTQRLWGDNLCDNAVGSTDALAILVALAHLTPLNHPAGCPGIGDPITAVPAPTGLHAAAASNWGDVNCGGEADSIDALSILLFVAHLTVPQPPAGCPHINDMVLVHNE